MIGQSFSHYKILEKIGQGGMGVVYLAIDVNLQRKVALKFFNTSLAKSHEQQQRLKREARLAAALNHPNIVTIYEVGEYDDRTYIAMEYVEGTALSKYIADAQQDIRKLPPVADAIPLAMQICNGLQAAHQEGIVHRDLKSDNILIDRKNRIRILDFGLARLKNGEQITKENMRMGTPWYMAPEQILNDNVDNRTDIFALGVILFELLCGHPPFSGDQDISVIYAILNENTPDLQQIRPDIPEWFCRLVEKCLQKDAGDRYRDISEIISELRENSGQQTLLPENTANVKPQKGLNKRIYAVTATVIALLLFASLYFITDSRRLLKPDATVANPQTAIAVLPFQFGGNEEFAYLGEGISQLLSTKLDGAGDLRSVDMRAMLGFMELEKFTQPGLNQGRAIAKRFAARYFILGSILEIDKSLSIEATLYDAADPRDILKKAATNGPASQLFQLVDDVATKLLTELTTNANNPLLRLATITTHSLPALKAYLNGEKEMRAGRYHEALAHFQSAVQEDTTFALDYYRLSLAADWLTRPQIANQAAQMAVKNNHRLSENYRVLLDALNAWQNGEADRAEQLYRTIVNNNRDQFDPWFQLGEVLFHYGPLRGRSISNARQAFETVLQMDPDHVPSLWHLARIAALEGKTIELKTFVNLISQLQPGGERSQEISALYAFALGDTKAQMQVIESLRNQNDYTIALAAWTVAVYTPDIGNSEKLAALLTEPSRSAEARTLGHIMLACLELSKGRWNAAKTRFALARQIDPVSSTEFWAHLSINDDLMQVEQNELVLLRNYLQENVPSDAPDNITPSIFFTVHNGLHPLLHDYLLASIDLMRRNTADITASLQKLESFRGTPEQDKLARNLANALRFQHARKNGLDSTAEQIVRMQTPETWYGLTIASPFFSQASMRFRKAEWLYANGEKEAAIPLYASFAEYSVYDLVFLPPADFRLGEIYAERGETTLARQYFRRFLKAWEGCDPGFLPRVDAARQRLAELDKH